MNHVVLDAPAEKFPGTGSRYAVILTQTPPFLSLTQTLADAKNIPLAQAARQVRQAGGFLEENLSESEARDLARALSRAGIDSLVTAQSLIQRLPPARRVRSLLLTSARLHLNLGMVDQKAARWEKVLALGAWTSRGWEDYRNAPLPPTFHLSILMPWSHYQMDLPCFEIFRSTSQSGRRKELKKLLQDLARRARRSLQNRTFTEAVGGSFGGGSLPTTDASRELEWLYTLASLRPQD